MASRCVEDLLPSPEECHFVPEDATPRAVAFALEEAQKNPTAGRQPYRADLVFSFLMLWGWILSTYWRLVGF